jgi:hypothetical protein
MHEIFRDIREGGRRAGRWAKRQLLLVGAMWCGLAVVVAVGTWGAPALVRMAGLSSIAHAPVDAEAGKPGGARGLPPGIHRAHPDSLPHLDNSIRAAVRAWLRENSPTATWDETRWWPAVLVEYGDPVRVVPAVRLKWRAGGAVRDTTFIVEGEAGTRALALGAVDARWYADSFPD